MYAIREIKSQKLEESYSGQDLKVILFVHRRDADRFYKNIFKPDGTFDKRTHEVVKVSITVEETI